MRGRVHVHIIIVIIIYSPKMRRLASTQQLMKTQLARYTLLITALTVALTNNSLEIIIVHAS